MTAEIVPGCYIHERPVKGWRIDRIELVRNLGVPDRWRVSLLRIADGAPIQYESAADLAEAYRGAADLAWEKTK